MAGVDTSDCQERGGQQVAAGKGKTVVLAPIESPGHINSLIAIADSLRHRGHRTVFLSVAPVDDGLLSSGHEVYDCHSEGLVRSDMSNYDRKLGFEVILNLMEEVIRNPSTENTIKWMNMSWTALKQRCLEKDAIFRRKLELIKPDVIICDNYFVQPAIIEFGKPWALVFSASPLGLHPKEDNLPPPFMGIPSNWMELGDEGARKQLYPGLDKYYAALDETFTDWIRYLNEERGFNLSGSFVQMSPFLNVHFYPEELCYRESIKGWQRCDSIIRINSKFTNFGSNGSANGCQINDRSTKPFEIPPQLRDKPGKLIFLSMGTLACYDVDLMKRLVSILSKSPHRFIVSMGLNWEKYELGPNMWGERHVDQLAILPLIDLIITHGGNNTITECFYFGVPGFIVCPAFADQRDNAQRIEECGLGKKVQPFKCTEEELLGSIEEVLADGTIRSRMKAISERMQRPENKYKAFKLFRELVEGQDDVQ